MNDLCPDGFSNVTAWLPHLLGWGFLLLLINAGNLAWQYAESSNGTLLAYVFYGSLFNAAVFYGNALGLYPQKRKHGWSGTYWRWVIAGLTVLSLTEGVIDYFYVVSNGLLPEETQSSISATTLIVGFGVTDGVIHVGYWLLSFAYVLLRQRSQFRQQQTELEQQKLTAELQYLKAQINPHVLFNGINSVYHLIDERPEQAKHTLLIFSNLLRYQLYECQEDRVPLTKELAHLTDYVTLEETRKGEDAVVEWDIPEETPPAQMAPMLLQPFVENAFKHLSHHEDRQQNRLRLLVAVDDGHAVAHRRKHRSGRH